MNSNSELPPILQIAAEFMGDKLIESGVPECKAVELALSCAREIMTALGGESVYIPKGVYSEYSRRDKQIYDEFGTLTMHQICNKYKITSRRVYQIVNAVSSGVEIFEHPKMFDESGNVIIGKD